MPEFFERLKKLFPRTTNWRALRKQAKKLEDVQSILETARDQDPTGDDFPLPALPFRVRRVAIEKADRELDTDMPYFYELHLPDVGPEFLNSFLERWGGLVKWVPDQEDAIEAPDALERLGGEVEDPAIRERALNEMHTETSRLLEEVHKRIEDGGVPLSRDEAGFVSNLELDDEEPKRSSPPSPSR